MTTRCAREGQAAGAPDKATRWRRSPTGCPHRRLLTGAARGSSPHGGEPRERKTRAWSIKWPPVGYVVLGVTYAVGGPLIGIGLYIVLRGSFPGWWMAWMLWPVKRVTPAVARLQGLTAVGLGASIVAIGLSTWVSELVGGLLVLIAMAAYLLGAGLFVYSTWLSRRVPAGSGSDRPSTLTGA